MTVAAPQYLVEPDGNGYLYGEVSYDSLTNDYIVTAEPSVLEMAKRVFPGCAVRRNGFGEIRFKGTRRAVGDLNWLMLRYPLKVTCDSVFQGHRHAAIEHSKRRAANASLRPTTPPSTLRGKLYGFQAEGVTFLIQNERTLLADDMGLGKTVTALGSLLTVDAFPVICVVPTTVQRQWLDMAAAWIDVRGKTLLGDIGVILKGRTPYTLPDVPFYIIHYGLLTYWLDALKALEPKAVIFDEIQELRHTGTMKYSAASYLSQEVRYVWGLSGTPIYNYGMEIWSVLNILDYHCLGDAESFSREWCYGYGSKHVRKPAVLGDHLRREGLMLRRRKDEVQSELPPKRRVTTDIDHDEGVYSKLIRRAVELARGYYQIKVWSEKGQAKREIEGAARMACGISKADYVCDFVLSLLAAGERPLVFAWHHAVHDILLERLRMAYRVGAITGRESQRDKEESKRGFSNGDLDALVLSLRTAAGLDGLQERGTCVVFAELDWSPAIHTQCEDRLHRMGAKAESILCYYLVSNTGYDRKIQSVLGLKVGQFMGLMGDSIETEESRTASKRATEDYMDGLIRMLADKGDV